MNHAISAETFDMSDRVVLSIVLPVHNVDPFLVQCLDSLLSQDLTAIEVIAVDDGSTDNSLEILASYAARDARVRVIRQSNTGVSVARNNGLQEARGKYVAFVDADDFVDVGLYASMVTMVETDELDMAMTNGWFHYDGRQPDAPIYRDRPLDTVVSGRAWLRHRLKQRHLAHMVWLHLYRREFLVTHGFRFVAGMFHQDVIWTNRVLLQAQRVRYHPAPRYSYRIRVRSCTTEHKLRHLTKVIEDSVFNAETLASIAANESDAEMQQLLRWQLVDGGLSVFHKLEQIPITEERQRQFLALMQRAYFRLLWENALEFRQRRRVLRHFLRNLFATKISRVERRGLQAQPQTVTAGSK